LSEFFQVTVSPGRISTSCGLNPVAVTETVVALIGPASAGAAVTKAATAAIRNASFFMV
jgi:hypothetical protein